jgi:hypothetical protein
MASTFYSLLDLADLSPAASQPKKEEKQPEPATQAKTEPKAQPNPLHGPTLHYDIQIHLPATKDVEVFNAIFKALKAHLFE